MRTTTAWSTPHHRLRRSLSSRRSLLVDALANWHQSLRSVSALNFHLRGSRQRSWMPGLAKPDRRGNIQGNGWRLRRSGHAEFSLPRVWPVIPSNFYPIDFHVTRRFFVSFLTQERNVPFAPSSFRSPPLLHRPGQPAQRGGVQAVSLAIYRADHIVAQLGAQALHVHIHRAGLII